MKYALCEITLRLKNKRKIMKKLLIITLMLLSTFTLSAQVEEEMEEEICFETEETGPTYRAPAVIPITGFYYPPDGDGKSFIYR